MLSATHELTHTWMHVAKTFVIIFPIYALGYFEFSFSWLLIGLVMFFMWRRNSGGKHSRIRRALDLMILFPPHKKTKGLNVHFPDVERVEWLNKTVKQMWPYICQFVEKLFHETIEPAPLRVNGVKVYTENVDQRQIIMDLQISFVGNTEIDVDIKRYYCKAGIKSIQIHGVLRVVMEPLLETCLSSELSGGHKLDRPHQYSGHSGLKGFSDNLIQDIIYSYLVLPNRITIPLVGDVELAKLRFPMPKDPLPGGSGSGGKDTFLGSDPYGVLQIGNQLFQSKAVKESLNPKWNEVYEWFDLEEAPTGKLHLKLEWLSLLATPEKLDKVLRSVRADRSLANDGLSSALLVVYLDSAKNLPSVFSGSLGCGNLSERRASGLVFCESNTSEYRTIFSAKKSSSEPSPFVQFTVGHKTLESKENMTLTQSFPLKNSGPSSTIKLRMALRILSLEKQVSSDLPSSVQVRNISSLTLQHRDGEPYSSSPLRSNNNNSLHLSETSLSQRLYGQPRLRHLAALRHPGAPAEAPTAAELHRRTLDVAVKNGGSILSKHKGFLGKILVDLSGEDISKGWTQWYDLSDDGVSSQSLRSIHDPLLS
ncbi:hypothetical protein F7725_029197 [Dissostichus mawsoni]|uniref:Extended synaptotagmin-like protein 2 n=1 Tax=Dissostichus mawsoni TaxID=36200 RepID=A0A7J5XJ74_DISMA|nr:hypothetical protein F7725_029197 [Dissostichus mawsoni]